ncbi:serine hydrolase domain-containing protein [Fulvivirga ligni]|uniref:serine hydrolase domain-containing protein n=1 Tax=Fulvivirga ligni TaxID=2904246 RepID=UPI001F3CDBA6|nr:serine hydrolase domain-containing protein [Fulvivirga ligni]UII19925.1 beta-lactamase family protein [Fulvivirga ligni]
MKNSLITLFLLFTLSAFGQDFITSEKAAEIEAYIKHFDSNHQLMGSVAIQEGNTTRVNVTFGEANLTDNEHLKYTVGSISKLFVAVMIAQLQEENKLNLDTKLSKFFPQEPNAKNISIKQMLNHTSGLKDFVSKDDSLHYWLKEPRSEKEILDEIVKQGVAFSAGDSISYSNSAYYLLGKILEIKYKSDFKSIVNKQIVEPLHLKNTVAIDNKNITAHVASSYTRAENDWNVIEEFYFPNVTGAGNIVSTPTDLNTFISALFSHKLIKEETLNAMLPKGKDWFGLGIMKVPFYDLIAYGHGGDTYGTHSVTVHDPKNNLTYSYVINGEKYPTNDFAIGLLSIIYDKEYTLPEFGTYNPDLALYPLYEGTYGAEGFPIDIKIFKDGDKLLAQGDGQPSFPLTPTDKHSFEFKTAGVKVTFDPDNKKLVLHQGGQAFELMKKI